MSNARRRGVVAAPFEDTPNPTWRHTHTFERAALAALDAATGGPYTTQEHHGGWLATDP